MAKKIKSNPLKNLKWELFCQYFIFDVHLRGNATLSYAEAYDYKLDELPDDDAVYEEAEEYSDEEGNSKKRSRHGKVIEPSTRTKAYNVCSVEGRRLLRTPKLKLRLTELLNEFLSDKNVDAELAKVILQDEERPAKVAGIREYNKLKQRIVDHHDVTSQGAKVIGIKYIVPTAPKKVKDGANN